MRAYFFGNMYLSSIQQGIQAAHVVGEMFVKYKMYGAEASMPTQQSALLDHWAKDHKTMVLLNAGYSEEIRSLVDFFSTNANPFPWASFNEGQDALDGALTSVGIILPEAIYVTAKLIRENDLDEDMPDFLLDQWEVELATRLNNYGLAR